MLLAAVLLDELLHLFLLEEVLLLSKLSLQDLNLTRHGHVVKLYSRLRRLQSEGFLIEVL